MYYGKRKNKYGNHKIKLPDKTFDSMKEYKRYLQLKQQEELGLLTELETQRRFLLVPKQKDERAVYYKADFYYKDSAGLEIVEDTKGFRTADYVIKRKLFKIHYPQILFREL